MTIWVTDFWLSSPLIFFDDPIHFNRFIKLIYGLTAISKAE
jgi:hypothetical protein